MATERAQRDHLAKIVIRLRQYAQATCGGAAPEWEMCRGWLLDALLDAAAAGQLPGDEEGPAA